MIKTPAQYRNYFKALAENHKAIKGFYRITFTGDLEVDRVVLGEFLNNMKNIETPCMLSVLFNANIVDNDSDNRLQDTKASFILLDEEKQDPAFPAETNFDKQEKIFQNTYDWGFQMMAYIKEDMDTNYVGWEDIQFKNWDFDFIGPLKSRFYGCMFNFSYFAGVNSETRYSSVHWNTPL